MDAAAEGNLEDEEIEVGSKGGLTESEEESVTGRPQKAAKVSKGGVGYESDEDARPDLRAGRGACLRYLCLYAYMVKVRHVSGDDWKKLCLFRDVAAAVVKWCDSADGEANLGLLDSLTVSEVGQFVEGMKEIWENRGKRILKFRAFVENQLQIRLPARDEKGSCLASYQKAKTGVLNLGAEESDSSLSSDSGESGESEGEKGKGKSGSTAGSTGKGKLTARRSGQKSASWSQGRDSDVDSDEERPKSRGGKGGSKRGGSSWEATVEQYLRGESSGSVEKGAGAAGGLKKAERLVVEKGGAGQKQKREGAGREDEGESWPAYTEEDAHAELFSSFPLEEEEGVEVTEDVARARAEAVLEELADGDGLQVVTLGGGRGQRQRTHRMYTYLDQFGRGLPVCSVFNRQEREEGVGRRVALGSGRVHQSVNRCEWSRQARSQLVLPIDLRGTQWASFCLAVLEGYFPIDHHDIKMIGSAGFQAAFAAAEADEWGVKKVGDIYILARVLTPEDSVAPRYVLDRNGEPRDYIHHAPRDTMRIVALLRECRRITMAGVWKLMLGADRVSAEVGRRVVGGVEVTLLRTPPEEGVVDASCLVDVMKRSGSRYEWGFLLRNAAGGMSIGEEGEGGGSFGRQQYLVPGVRDLEGLMHEQAVSRLVVTSIGREWQMNGGGRLIGSCRPGKRSCMCLAVAAVPVGGTVLYAWRGCQLVAMVWLERL